jgi:hypothetical protein
VKAAALFGALAIAISVANHFIIHSDTLAMVGAGFGALALCTMLINIRDAFKSDGL